MFVETPGDAGLAPMQGGAGQLVLDVLDRRKQQKEREGDLQKAVERRLRLRRLLRDPAISHDRCSPCNGRSTVFLAPQRTPVTRPACCACLGFLTELTCKPPVETSDATHQVWRVPMSISAAR